MNFVFNLKTLLVVARSINLDMKQVRKFSKIFVKLPSCLMKDYPILPLIGVQKGDTKDCQFAWYREITSKERETLICPNNEVLCHIEREGRAFWYKLTDELIYKPSEEDLARRLRFVCWMTDGTSESPRYRCISQKPVELGPADCPFEKRHQYTNQKLVNPEEFRVVSYNILADLYADSDYSRTVLFAHCPAYALEIDYRRQLLLKEILGYNADIVCLQEVDKKEFARYYEPMLKISDGLIGVFDAKGGHLQEGTATFYREDRFELVDSHRTVITSLLGFEDDISTEVTNCLSQGDQESIQSTKIIGNPRSHPILDSGDQVKIIECVSKFKEIRDTIESNPEMKKRFLDRNTILQTSLLKLSTKEKNFVIVANTHFYFAPDADHIRLLQGCICAKYIEHIKEFYSKLVEDTLNISDPDLAVVFCGDLNSTPECGTYQLLTEGKVSQDLVDWSSNDAEAVTGLNFQTKLRFSSAYQGIEYTNFTPEFKGCLDYIYFERDRLGCDSTVPLPCHEDVSVTGGIPSEVFPSDHLALVANLKIINNN